MTMPNRTATLRVPNTLRAHRAALRALMALVPVFSSIFLVARSAAAETTIAGDLDYAIPIDANATDSGPGFGIRLGQQLHMPLIALTPEIGFTWAHFGGDFDPTVYRGLAGLRLGVGEILRPGVYAHAGIGHLSWDAPRGLPDPSHTAFSFDAGAFVDFTLLPFINIGVHGAYNQLASGDYVDALKWATVGAHAALVF